MLTLDDPTYFDVLADVEARHWWSLAMWRIVSWWLDDALSDRSGLRALDVGCGAGLTTGRLSRRREVGSVKGLDPSAGALARAARSRAGPLIRGSALSLPFGDASFDLVTCFDVFQHLPPRGDAVAACEIRRVLAPGGIVVVRSNGRGWSGGPLAYNLEGLTSILEGARLDVRRATYANALPAMVQEVRAAARRRRDEGERTRSAHRTLQSFEIRAHPAGGGLQIRVPGPAQNRLMKVVSGAEAWAAGRLGVRLPFGHSTLVLAERLG
jgi:SAM-dependent methyltransferase